MCFLSIPEPSANPIQALILKDACYLAIGSGYYHLYDYVDFPSWFANDLAKQLEQIHLQFPEYVIFF